jgi:hypothetical protein
MSEKKLMVENLVRMSFKLFMSDLHVIGIIVEIVYKMFLL